MRLGLPPVPPSPLAPTISRAFQRLEQAFGQVVTTAEAAPFVMLQSPAGKVYKVTVDDAGVLTTTEVPIGRDPP